MAFNFFQVRGAANRFVCLTISTVCGTNYIDAIKVSHGDMKGNAALAQLVEHLTCNHEVSGSIPGGGSKAVV